MPGFRLMSVLTTEGARASVVVDDRVFDAEEITADPRYASILGILDDWEHAEPRLRALASSRQLTGMRSQPIDKVKALTPVRYPTAIYCAGANYMDHVANMAKSSGLPPPQDPRVLGLKPWHFLKPSRCAVGDGDIVAKPSLKLDWEAELAAVIGRTCRNVSMEGALDYVAGYTVANDLSARDLGPRNGLPDNSPFKYDWVAHKGFEHSCPVGPWITPASEIGDPQILGIKSWVNGSLKQDSNTNQMIFTTAEQIANLSSRITLHPGDLVLTGTPAGVGAERGEFLEVGDLVEVWIEKLGKLTTHIGPPSL